MEFRRISEVYFPVNSCFPGLNVINFIILVINTCIVLNFMLMLNTCIVLNFIILVLNTCIVLQVSRVYLA